MLCLIQRVSQASVSASGEVLGEIGVGMMVLCAFQPGDTIASLQKMAHKLVHYRLFSDENDRMNLNISQSGGQILLVPQFTLAADTQKGLRPSFHTCAEPEKAKQAFQDFIGLVEVAYQTPQTGRFGADMQVALINDGPVTFQLSIL